MKKYKIGYTTGVFDMFHMGHLNILRRAKEQCDYLIVGVSTDALCQEYKNRLPVICEADRMAIVESIRYVDLVIPQVDMDKVAVVRKYGVQAVFVGSDWKGTAKWEKFQEEFAAEGCDVIYLPRTEGISSSSLRNRVNEI